MAEIKLSKCAFCGSERIRTMLRAYGGDVQSAYAECLGCGAQGPVKSAPRHEAEAAAAQAWADVLWTHERVLALANYIAREAFDAGQDDVIIPSPLTPADQYAERRASELVEEFEVDR